MKIGFEIMGQERAHIYVYLSYFVLGLISAGVSIFVSERFPEPIRPWIRIVIFSLGLFSIKIDVKAES